MKDKEKILPCPRCGEPVHWNRDARWKPFCSERCRLIDLGAWFAEEHAIPGERISDTGSEDPESSQD